MGSKPTPLDLKETEADYNAAFAGRDFPKIQEIVSILNNASPTDKAKTKLLYERIFRDVFSLGRKLPNYDLPKFLASIGAGKTTRTPSPKKPITTIPIIGVPITTSAGEAIEELFIRLYNVNLELIAGLKDFYFFAFETDVPTEKTEIIILCDEQSKKNPMLTELVDVNGVKLSEAQSIDEFIGIQSKADNPFDRDYLVILCIAPTLGGSGIRAQLVDLFELPYTIRAISVLPFAGSISVGEVLLTSQNESTINQICDNTDKVFANLSLPYEEQKLIKTFFNLPGVVNYRVLTQGWSGATVFEVQHIRTDMPTTRRFVAKVAPKRPGAESKLSREMTNFDNYVLRAPGTTAYNARYVQTNLLEAIFYTYASSDGLQNSRALKEILDDFLDPDGKTVFADLTAIIDRLWDCEILQAWPPNRTCEIISKLFEPHIASTDLVIAEIKKILLPADFSKTTLISNFGAIVSKKLDTQTKVCHGDLHSQNLFDDGNTVILIDFGITGLHHALIDHVFLEASIRLRHFPRYIPPEELLVYDKHFLDIASFDSGFDLGFISRQPLRDLYALLVRIRSDATKYLVDSTSPDEYLVALFIIIFRLIRYDSLNQLYALRLAERLGEHLKNSAKLL